MKSILIRAEDKNIWERRAPMVPADLKELVSKDGIKAWVQRSDKRFFREQAYLDAGAEICDDMSHGDIILGIKEIPEDKLLDDKVYLFFSHTIKGQKSNMPMLKRIMDGKSTLIDYEKITDASNRRLVFFGRYAGDAGAIDILWLMGEYWKHQGLVTPFKDWKQAVHYHSVDEAMQELSDVGEKIRKDGLPEAISPMIIGILGYGNVSTGAQMIFDCLPTERIAPAGLSEFVQSGQANPNTVYVVVFKEKDMVRRKDGQSFDLQDYYKHPGEYESTFAGYLPHLTILVNATFWDYRYPRFVHWEDLETLYARGEIPKLRGIADITCDVNGSIECNVKTTNTGMPAYRCDPLTRSVTDGYKGEGIVLLAVDNLPAEIPNDSSTFFSGQLKPFIPELVHADFSGSLDASGLPEALRKAVIVYKGELMPDYAYLAQYL